MEETANSRSSVDALHDSTRHGTPPAHPHRLIGFRRLDPANAPSPFKEYRDREAVPLPRDLLGSGQPAVRILSGLSSQPRPLDLPRLATLLFLTGGVTRVARGAGGDRSFRTAMSAGNLHPVEIYPVLGPGFGDFSEGVHHFAPGEHGLHRLRRGDFRPWMGARRSAALVITGIVWRTAWKYGERGWRHLYWDAGTLVANLLTAADGYGIDAQVHVAFDDGVVSRLVGVDGQDEMPLAVVTLGTDEAWPESEPDLPALSPDVAPVAPKPVRLPLVVEAQEEGRSSSDQVGDWLSRAGEVVTTAPARIEPAGGWAELPVEEVILRRGSTRHMVQETIDRDRLDWPMAAATRAVPWDLSPEGGLLDHFLGVHAIEGVRPGAYRWTGAGLDSIRHAPDIRERSAALCLGQPLGGDSAYTAFHTCRLDRVLDVLGARGYRAAQLEAGVVSGRLALCAFATGLGATGLTFFDDPVSEFFETAASPMLVTSIGVPASPPAPAGTPGQPAELTGYGDLMSRMMTRLRRR